MKVPNGRLPWRPEPSVEDQRMAHLWFADENAGGAWADFVLAGSRYTLTATGPELATAANAAHAALVRCETADNEWLLLVTPGSHVAVNGQPVALGFRALHDRDEITLTRPEVGADGCVSARRFYFSTETRARVQPMPLTGAAIHCGRCRQVIAGGQPAVQCPTCRVWQHQSAELPCWTYGAHCGPSCAQPTRLDGGPCWSPAAEVWREETADSVSDDRRGQTEVVARRGLRGRTKDEMPRTHGSDRVAACPNDAAKEE